MSPSFGESGLAQAEKLGGVGGGDGDGKDDAVDGDHADTHPLHHIICPHP